MDSPASLAFWHAPLAQLLICPWTDRILAANSEACKFFVSDIPSLKNTAVSQLFRVSLPDLIVFSDEALQVGRAWSDSLSVERPAPYNQSRVEIYAMSFTHEERALLQFTFQDADHSQEMRDQAEAQRQFRSGLGQWNRMTKVFQEFERENRLILEAAGEGIYGVDADGMTTFMNPAAERILGWQAEELLGKNIHHSIHYRHVDGSHYHVGECPIYSAFREGNATSVEDDVFWSKDGLPIDVEYTSTPIKDNGEVVGAVVIFRDVTEKKQAQKKLLDALNEVEHLKTRLEMENAYLQEELSSEFNHHQMVGRSHAILSVLQKIELVAPSDATVLISGESGTGKELIARAIHDLSQRSQRSLIRVNCAAIPSELFESEFFGHIRGAFTGATSDRPGRFELADGGTLFLDEVGEIPLALQGKLLRVIQEQQYERIGEATTRHVDVRIIAATNRDLKALVEQGKFREDLYFRLNVFPIESIPLRKRKGDIPLLAQHFLQRASTRANKPGLKISFSELEKLQNYAWPGNIRELENIIERQVILAQGNTLRFDDLSPSSQRVNDVLQPRDEAQPLLTDDDFKSREKQNLIAALKLCHGKVSGHGGAAAMLNIKPTTLASRLKRYRIHASEFKQRVEVGA